MIPFGKAMVDGECRHNDGSEVNNIDDAVDVNTRRHYDNSDGVCLKKTHRIFKINYSIDRYRRFRVCSPNIS